MTMQSSETPPKMITHEYLQALQMKVAIYDAFMQQFIHAPADKLQQIQNKAIELAPKLGIEFVGKPEMDFEENKIYGKIIVTSKRIAEDGWKFNIASVDEDGSVLAGTRKMDVSERDLATISMLKTTEDVAEFFRNMTKTEITPQITE